MSRAHGLVACAAVAAAVVALTPATATATAADRPSLQDLVLSGSCGDSSELKNIIVTPRTPWLFMPVRIVDGGTFKPTGKWLFPYTVGVTGEGLKTRHMLPGQTYTRPGRPLRNQVTCFFEGATKEDGAFQVQITGSIFGH